MKEPKKLLIVGMIAVHFFAPGLIQADNIIRILVPETTSSLPLLQLAVEDPLPGFDIQCEFFINHPQALVRLLKGEVDLLLTGTSQGWNNYFDGGPLVMINTGVWGLNYLVGNDSSINSLHDLRGKKIVLPFPGSPLDFQTRYILRRQNIDPEKDLVIDYSPFLQTIQKLLSRQIDAAPFPEPLASNLLLTQGLYRLFDYKQLWAEVSGGDPKCPLVSLFGTNAYAQAHLELIVELVEAWRIEAEKVQRYGDETAKRFTGALHVPSTIIMSAIHQTLFGVPSFEENEQRVRSYCELVNDMEHDRRLTLKQSFFFKP